METNLKVLVILGIVALAVLIVFLLYSFWTARKKNILYTKTDYLLEDMTYKSEMLTSTVETISKISNYIDMFEVVTRKNSKSFAKLVARNKEDIYKILDRFKKIAMGESDSKDKESAENDAWEKEVLSHIKKSTKKKGEQ